MEIRSRHVIRHGLSYLDYNLELFPKVYYGIITIDLRIKNGINQYFTVTMIITNLSLRMVSTLIIVVTQT